MQENPCVYGLVFGKMRWNFCIKRVKSIKKYMGEAMSELRRVQTPTKNHAIRVSIITAVFVVTSAVIITVVDISLSKLLFLISQ